MPVAIETIPLFLGAALILLIVPGPNMAYVLASGAAQGWRGGLAAALGIGAVDLLFTLATALGAAAVITTYPAAFTMLRWSGAAYLLWLAWTSVRTARAPAAERPAAGDIGKVFLRGVLANIANPKAILFYLVFIPQFVDPARGAVLAQFVCFGAGLALVGTLFHAALGAIAAAGRAVVLSGPNGNRGLHWLQAAIFVAIAGRLVFA
jgi:threonine/homoserine/homoserine lactone efflux protein